MNISKFVCLSLFSLLLLSGCSKPTPAEIQDARFDLPNNYDNKIENEIRSKVGFVQSVNVYSPDEDCSSGLFGSFSCVYKGTGSVDYLNGYLLVQGRKVIMHKNFRYSINKSGRIRIK